MTGFEDDVHIAASRNAAVGRSVDARVHQLRSWLDRDTIVRGGIRLTCAPLASIHAAIWARSRRQAALVLVMAVQQRLTTGPALLEVIAGFERLRRRDLITAVVHDTCAGVQSLGELDFARECRRRGLPEPDRQVVRRGRRGRVYLDVFFDTYGLVVEIEGAHHAEPAQILDDALRQNELTIARDAVLRIPLVGWRIDPAAYLDQVERALRERGWPGR
jgi:very-short-patch-repair endonuclease